MANIIGKSPDNNSYYRKFIYILETGWGWVEKLAVFLIMLLMSFLVIITFMQVFYRYVLNNPLTWSEELARYIFIWIVFLASWYVFKKGGHLGMDFFTQKLSANLQKWLGRLIDGIILVFIFLILKNTPQFLKLTLRQTSAALKIPMGYIYLAFPVSTALMFGEIVLSWLNPERKSPGEINVETSEIEKEGSDLNFDLDLPEEGELN